jgi:dishevelled associated activator of morphogenesis
MDYVSALLSMDSKEELPMDMVEQLLKFIPTNEERALLDERSSDLDSLSRADRLLYDVSKYVDSPWLLSLALVVFHGKLHCE